MVPALIYLALGVAVYRFARLDPDYNPDRRAIPLMIALWPVVLISGIWRARRA